MGVVSLPRLYFQGFTYWNPCTFNNNDALPTYDSPNARVNWSYLNARGIYSEEAFRRYAITPSIAPGEILPPAEWNYYGGQECSFVGGGEPAIEMPDHFSKPSVDTVITGYTGPDGTYVPGGDWGGQLVRFNYGGVASKLVDVDPISFWSSQIFNDTFWIGDEKSGLGLTGPTVSRSYSRWMNVLRNYNANGQLLIAGGASAMFQTCLAKDQIRFFQQNAPSGSLTEFLQETLKAPGTAGLMLRYVTYETLYFNGEAFAGLPVGDVNSRMIVMARLYQQYEDQLAAYARGDRKDKPKVPMNRAYSKTVGWLGPWMENELPTVPSGRLLGATYLTPAKAGQTSIGLLMVQPPSLGPTALGPTAVEYAADPQNTANVGRITLDLGTTIPEIDNSETKVNIGTLELGLVPVGETSQTPNVFAKIPYDQYNKAAYEQTSGVLDIPASAFTQPLTVEQLNSAQLVITAESTTPSTDPNTPPTVSRGLALAEHPIVAETDQRGVYLEEPPMYAPPDVPQKNFSIQVRYLGQKPPQGCTLCIAQYAPQPPGVAEGSWLAVSERKGTPQQSPIVELMTTPLSSGDGYVVVEIPYEDDGKPFATVNVGLKPLMPGFPTLSFYPFLPGQSAVTPPLAVSAPAIADVFFTVIRVLPFNNLMARQFEEWLKTNPTVDQVNQRVFNDVFGMYHLIFPVMSFIRDAMKFQAFRGKILEVTAPSFFDASGYMPVNRALSAGQRRILELWSTYLDGPPPPARKAVRRRG